MPFPNILFKRKLKELYKCIKKKYLKTFRKNKKIKIDTEIIIMKRKYENDKTDSNKNEIKKKIKFDTDKIKSCAQEYSEYNKKYIQTSLNSIFKIRLLFKTFFIFYI